MVATPDDSNASADDADTTDNTAPSPLVEVTGVGRRFGSTVALADVDMRVLRGSSHALVGRNGAGKSTLVSLLTGMATPDTGEIRFAGQPAPPIADRDAWRSRVACVYQRPTVIPDLTVAENLFLNRQPTGRFGRIDWAGLHRDAGALLEQYGVTVDPDRQVRHLTVEDRQMVEIARALSFGARFIVLDEPTAQLNSTEIEKLFTRMRALQDAGVTFLYISHHLHEVFEVCHEVTVLRDARRILTERVASLGEPDLVRAMTGEAQQLAEGVAEPRVVADAPAVLRVRGLASAGFRGVDLEVREGEVVGLAGTSGSGKVELAETLAGLRAASAGEVDVDGRSFPTGDVSGALAARVGFVPRDRHDQGIVPGLSVAENGTMTISGRLGPAGLIRPAALAAAGRRAISDLDIHTRGPEQTVSTLSGGNQQKVVMARALATEPRVLVLINPTAGVDVKSKESLLGVVDSVRDSGTAVIVASDELDDLRRCDRVAVLFQGEVTVEHAAGWTDEELVGSIEGIGIPS